MGHESGKEYNGRRGEAGSKESMGSKRGRERAASQNDYYCQRSERDTIAREWAMIFPEYRRRGVGIVGRSKQGEKRAEKGKEEGIECQQSPAGIGGQSRLVY